MKRILLILPLFLFASCVSTGGGYVSFDKSEFYEIKVGGEDEAEAEDEDSAEDEAKVSYFVSYPQSGVIEESDDIFEMNYKNCSVEFGEGLDYEADPNDFVEIKRHNERDVSYQAWYEDDLLVRYGGVLSVYGYNFWLSDYENGVSDCILILEGMAESFTDKPFYYNEKFGFKVDLLSDYKLEYLPSGEGVLMKKWIEGVCVDEWGDEYECGYKVEIYAMAFENMMGYVNLADFIANKYGGFSAEFADFGNGAGVFIDEGAGEDGIRHYFMMGEGANVIYEAYLKVPSVNYSAHKEEFGDFVPSLEIFL